MVDTNTDVDLDKALGLDKSGAEAAPGASDQKKPDETIPPAVDKTPAEDFSPRAKDRIDQLLKENEQLKTTLSARTSSDFDEFVNSIQDEPSRNLLKQYGSLLEKRVEQKYAPVLSNYRESEFERQFADFSAKVPSLAGHKEDIKKTFLRDPNADLRKIVAERVLDISTAQIKPLETAPSQVNRDGAPSLEDASKDDLYAILETQKPPLTR